MSRSLRKPAGEDPTYIGVVDGFETDPTVYTVWADFEKELVWVTWGISQEAYWDFRLRSPDSKNPFWYHIWNMVKAFKEDMEDPSVSPNCRQG